MLLWLRLEEGRAWRDEVLDVVVMVAVDDTDYTTF
jgi:hypothetical protein